MKNPGNKLSVILLAALAALVIAGCGGGDETETTTPTVEEPTVLTKAELIEEGDDICAEVNAAVGALGAEAAETAVPDTIEKSANLYTGMIERIQELGAPADDDGSYAEFMEAAEEFAKVEGDVKLAAEREDTVALGEAATEAAPALEGFQEAAEDYGFEDCAEGPSAPSTAGSGEAAPGGEEFEGGEEGGVEAEPELEEAPEEEIAPEEEPAPETGGAGGGAEPAPEGGGESGGGSESGGVGPG